MLRLSLFLLLSAPLLLTPVPGTAAETGSSPAISTMAAIVMHMNHYPSEGEKSSLRRMIDDPETTGVERTLAGVLMRMEHRVEGADAARLRTLANDDDVGDGARELAEILLGFNHKASERDRERLRELMQ